MINSITFTIKDVCLALGGVNRSRVHAWTKFAPFSLMGTSERSARRFSTTDLLTLAVIQTLDDTFGLRNSILSIFSPSISQYLIEPRAITSVELVFLRLRDGLVLPQTLSDEPGYLLDIARERERINIFLGIAPPQRQLPLMKSIGASRK